MKFLGLLLSITVLIVLLIDSAEANALAELPLRVNLGSTSAYETRDGITYLPDQAWNDNLAYGYVGGQPVKVDTPIGGTLDESLYTVQRAKLEAYNFGGLEPGEYIVELHFAEISAHKAGDTLLNVTAEGQLVIASFDPYVAAQSTREYAFTRRFAISVTDGLLNLNFIPIRGTLQIAAIALLPAVGSGEALVPPVDLTITPSYNAMILDWADVDAIHRHGYMVYRAPTPDGPYTPISPAPVYTSRMIDLFDDWEASLANIATTVAVTSPSQIDWYYKVATVSINETVGELGSVISGRPLSIEDITLPVYHLTIGAESLAKLNPDVNDVSVHPAQLTYDGSVYNVNVRYRGQFTRKYAKKSWKIIFDGDSPFSSRNEVDLKSHYDDISLIRGLLTTQIYKKLGISPPEARHALLFVNDEYYGVYTDYERVDESFLARTGRSAGSTVYETLFTNRWNYGQTLQPDEYPLAYKLRTNQHLGYEPLQTFLETVNLVPRQFFTQSLERIFNVQNYLKYYAGIMFTGNTDFTRHNVFFVNDLERATWEVIPWDPDLTWGNDGGFSLTYSSNMELNTGTFGGPNVLHGPNVFLTQVLGEPQYHSFYCRQLQTLSTDSFVQEQIYPLIDRYHDQIRAAAYADWRKFGWESHNGFDESKALLKEYAQERSQFIRARLDAFCPLPASLLTINEMAPDTHTVLCDPSENNAFGCNEQWIEIHNPNLESVDLQGLYLTNDLSNPTRHRFDQSLVIEPSGQVVVWLDSEPFQGANHANFSLLPQDTSVALVAADGTTVYDEFEIVARGHDIFIQRYPDGGSETYFTGPTEVSPGDRNHLAATIRAVATSPAEPTADQDVEVTINLFPENEFVDGNLHYRINGATQAVPLKRKGYGQFVATIPAQSEDTHVEYYLAVQSYIGEAVSPATALNEGSFHQYLVGYNRPLVSINEVRANHDSGVSSWFEIYNDENDAIDLGGMYLSDDPSNPRKYQIPDELPEVQPGGYTVFYANGTPNLSSQHTNFILADENGSIALYDSDETFNQPISSFRYDSAPSFGAYQRCTNNSSIWLVTTSPTPGYTNSPACKIVYLPLQ